MYKIHPVNINIEFPYLLYIYCKHMFYVISNHQLKTQQEKFLISFWISEVIVFNLFLIKKRERKSMEHLNKTIKDTEIKIAGYEIVRNDRKQGSAVGVCVFFRNDLSWLGRRDFENDQIEAIWIEIFPQRSKPNLICFSY